MDAISTTTITGICGVFVISLVGLCTSVFKSKEDFLPAIMFSTVIALTVGQLLKVSDQLNTLICLNGGKCPGIE